MDDRVLVFGSQQILCYEKIRKRLDSIKHTPNTVRTHPHK